MNSNNLNSSNLIAALPPAEYKRWRSWLWSSSIAITSVIIILSILSAIQLFSGYRIRKQALLLAQQSFSTVSQEYKNSKKQLKTTRKKIKKLTHFSSTANYSVHLNTLADAMPACMRLSSLSIDGTRIELKGEVTEIELLLTAIQTLEKTPLFQSMNLVELTPSDISKDEKKLLQFTIIGKLPVA